MCVCMHICMYGVHMCSRVHVCADTCGMWRSNLKPGIFLYLLKEGLLLNLGCTNSDYQLVSLLLSSKSAKITGDCHACPDFTWVLGIQPPVLIFA